MRSPREFESQTPPDAINSSMPASRPERRLTARLDPRHDFGAHARGASPYAPRVVAIDDDPLIRRTFEVFFGGKGYTLSVAAGGAEGMEQIRAERPDVVIVDNVLPDVEGLDLLKKIRALDPCLPVVVITGQGNVRTAIDAMKLSAFDYLPKPLDLAQLDALLLRAVKVRRGAPAALHQGRLSGDSDQALVGDSPAMQQVYKAIGRLAPLDAPILICGEIGTGKELIARAIHQNGLRSAGPLRVVHCADFSPAELDRDLFGSQALGHDPNVVMPGRIEHCRGGVLVLGGIERLPPATQSRLVRLVRDGKYERVGGHETLPANVQLIAATTADPESCFAAGKLQPEFYYLFRSFQIKAPPLRERLEDLPLLVAHFLNPGSVFAGSADRQPTQVTDEFLKTLCRHSWPGNLDELQSVLRRAAVDARSGVLSAECLASIFELTESQTNEARPGDDRLAIVCTASNVGRIAKHLRRCRRGDGAEFADADPASHERQSGALRSFAGHHSWKSSQEDSLVRNNALRRTPSFAKA